MTFNVCLRSGCLWTYRPIIAAFTVKPHNLCHSIKHTKHSHSDPPYVYCHPKPSQLPWSTSSFQRTIQTRSSSDAIEINETGCSLFLRIGIFLRISKDASGREKQLCSTICQPPLETFNSNKIYDRGTLPERRIIVETLINATSVLNYYQNVKHKHQGVYFQGRY